MILAYTKSAIKMSKTCILSDNILIDIWGPH